MSLNVFHLDGALEQQKGFMAACHKRGACEIDMRDEAALIRLWGTNQQLRNFQSRLCEHLNDNTLPTPTGPWLTFMGSGDFHHVTALILECLMEKTEDSVTVIHIDNHPDWVRFTDGTHCGSWINHALETPRISKMISIGMDSKDLSCPEFKGANLDQIRQGRLAVFPLRRKTSWVWNKHGPMCKSGQWQWNAMADMAPDAFMQMLYTSITTSKIYITLDKDALLPSAAITNWDQGGLSLERAMEIIRGLADNFEIVGMDVIGDYSPPLYSGDTWTVLKKRAEVFLDQPWKSPNIEAASRLNEETNLKLLAFLTEVVR